MCGSPLAARCCTLFRHFRSSPGKSVQHSCSMGFDCSGLSRRAAEVFVLNGEVSAIVGKRRRADRQLDPLTRSAQFGVYSFAAVRAHDARQRRLHVILHH